MNKESIRARQRARKLLVQALYQWNMTAYAPSEIEAQFRVAKDMEKVDTEYFCRILYGVVAHHEEIDAKIDENLDRGFEVLQGVELSAMRMGAFELLFCLETPYRVILDECIQLTKHFGSQDGHRYVNGILHAIARQARAIEME